MSWPCATTAATIRTTAHVDADFALKFPAKQGTRTDAQMTLLVPRAQLLLKDVGGTKQYSLDVVGEDRPCGGAPEGRDRSAFVAGGVERMRHLLAPIGEEDGRRRSIRNR